MLARLERAMLPTTEHRLGSVFCSPTTTWWLYGMYLAYEMMLIWYSTRELSDCEKGSNAYSLPTLISISQKLFIAWKKCGWQPCKLGLIVFQFTWQMHYCWSNIDNHHARQWQGRRFQRYSTEHSSEDKPHEVSSSITARHSAALIIPITHSAFDFQVNQVKHRRPSSKTSKAARLIGVLVEHFPMPFWNRMSVQYTVQTITGEADPPQLIGEVRYRPMGRGLIS